MVVHTAHSDLRKTDIETLKDELRRNPPSAHISNNTFQQVLKIFVLHLKKNAYNVI